MEDSLLSKSRSLKGLTEVAAGVGKPICSNYFDIRDRQGSQFQHWAPPAGPQFPHRGSLRRIIKYPAEFNYPPADPVSQRSHHSRCKYRPNRNPQNILYFNIARPKIADPPSFSVSTSIN